MSDLDDVIAIMARLRAPGGCPWDREQTHETLAKYAIEESAELVEAIESGDSAAVRDELGDVLLQVLFHADIASEHEGWDIQDVAKGLADKLRRRHPHVFAEVHVDDADEVIRNWNAIKATEQPERTGPFDGIPVHLPALQRAQKVLDRAARHGVQIPTPDAHDDGARIGQALFALVAEARAAGIDAEGALRTEIARVTRSE